MFENWNSIQQGAMHRTLQPQTKHQKHVRKSAGNITPFNSQKEWEADVQ